MKPKSERMSRFMISGMLAFLLVLAVAPSSYTITALPTLRLQSPRATLPSPQPGVNLPQAAVRCLEPVGNTFEVVGTLKEKGKTYYYLHVWLYDAGDDFESWYSLIEINSSGCRQLRGAKSGLKPLSSFMSMAPARKLELQRYRHEIAKAGGKGAFEQRLNQKLSPSAHSAYSGVTIYLSQEQVWALRQLGIRFPNTYKLLRSGETIGGGNQ